MVPRCLVKGYEINAQHFGNPLRYVTYSRKTEDVNVLFVRVARPASKLSYWRLHGVRNFNASSEEKLIIAYPQSGRWLEFLFTGYSHKIPRSPAKNIVVNESYDLLASITTLRKFEDDYSHGTSPLPIFPPRIL